MSSAGSLPARTRTISDDQEPSTLKSESSVASRSEEPESADDALKGLGAAPRQTREGQPQKRRGPKPDSKPAMTRRQELNRQAQRTHRERKEQYTKALEKEVLHLRDVYGSAVRERDAAIHESNNLRELLRSHGIALDATSPSNTYPTASSRSLESSVTGSFRAGSDVAAMSPSPSHQSHQSRSPQQVRAGSASLPTISNNNIDYDQLGVEFVLSLERTCSAHMQYLVVRSHNADNQPFRHPAARPDDMEHEHMCGHALMLTCPPIGHVMGKPGEPYPHKTPDLPKPDLTRLYEASVRLPIDGGEITPIQAWYMITSGGSLSHMTSDEFELVKNYLSDKARCYGFGAVLEEFEVRDALGSVFAAREAPFFNNGMQDVQLTA